MSAVFQVLLVVSLLVSSVLSVLGARRYPRPDATAFAAFMAGTVCWSGGALGTTLADTVAGSILWTRFQYLGIATVPVSWLALTAYYSGADDGLTRRRLAVLAAVSVSILATVWTNDAHHLFYSDVYASQATLAGYDVDHGPLYLVWLLVGYGLILAGCALLVRMLYHDKRIYRQQAAATLVAAVGPFLANAAYNVGVTASDTTPVAFAVSGVALGWAMYRFEFLQLAPVTRRTVVDNIRDGVLVLDDENRFVDVNPAARRLLELEDVDVLGRPASTVLDTQLESLRDRAATVDDDGDVVTFDTEHGQRFLAVDVRPYRDGNGRERGRLFYLQDVTERERRERELARQNEQLDRFASLVSHDLRNPLNVAEGYVQTARSSGDYELLEEVVVSHDRMHDIVDDVLDLARNGRTVTDVEPLSVAAVARDAWESVDTGEATLVVDATTTVLADESRLRQLFENLYRNSRQHGTPADATDTPNASDAPDSDLTITVGDHADGFFVADDGVGIPESDRDAILEDGYSTHDDGTGLGLSIVTSVASGHDWTVSVTESENGGARFEFTGTTVARDVPRPETAAD